MHSICLVTSGFSVHDSCRLGKRKNIISLLLGSLKALNHCQIVPIVLENQTGKLIYILTTTASSTVIILWPRRIDTSHVSLVDLTVTTAEYFKEYWTGCIRLISRLGIPIWLDLSVFKWHHAPQLIFIWRDKEKSVRNHDLMMVVSLYAK